MLLKTNLSYEVRKIITECFPKENKLSKIINKNTVKIDYCTKANLVAKINQHNTKILKNQEKDKKAKTCNCNKNINAICPVGEKCLTKCVIYTAEVTITRKEK